MVSRCLSSPCSWTGVLGLVHALPSCGLCPRGSRPGQGWASLVILRENCRWCSPVPSVSRTRPRPSGRVGRGSFRAEATLPRPLASRLSPLAASPHSCRLPACAVAPSRPSCPTRGAGLRAVSRCRPALGSLPWPCLPPAPSRQALQIPGERFYPRDQGLCSVLDICWPCPCPLTQSSSSLHLPATAHVPHETPMAPRVAPCRAKAPCWGCSHQRT